jgi:hypothetical protein
MSGSGSAYRSSGLGGRGKGARLLYASADRKLAPVRLDPHYGRPRPVPIGPYCSATYASIEATCPTSCRFRAGACYVTAGFTAQLARSLDEAARGMDGDAVIDAEAALIEAAFKRAQVPQDGARGGRDLRLHVGGDASSDVAAQRLAWAVDTWRYRGGGDAWTFTHRWREIHCGAWGSISALASVETIPDARAAVRLGYVPALVVDSFPSGRAYRVRGLRGKVIPCPSETTEGKVTCVECRLCLDAGALRRRERAIAFSIHGIGSGRVQLPVIKAAT